MLHEIKDGVESQDETFKVRFDDTGRRAIFSCDGDDENQAPSTEIYEDNCRLNRTINYPGQDRAIVTFYFAFSSICFALTEMKCTDRFRRIR
jgi:hypothetical protein